MTQVVVFDLDDTLVSERDYVISGFAAVGVWVEARFGVAGFGGRALRHFEAGRRGDIFDLALRESGLEADLAVVRDLVHVYRDHTPAIELLEDARWWLEHGRSPDVALALITDGAQLSQQRKVAALGLAPVFEPIVYTDAFGRAGWKPNPTAFQAVMAHYPGVAAAAFTYVGDNPSKDFVAPNALGWRTVRVSRPGGEYLNVAVPAGGAAQCQIDSLRDLNRAILACEPAPQHDV